MPTLVQENKTEEGIGSMNCEFRRACGSDIFFRFLIHIVRTALEIRPHRK